MSPGQNFVLLIIMMSMGSWIVTSWIRARHGYPLESEDGKILHPRDPQADRKFDLLSNENERLKGQILRLEERVAVLERIATDSSARLSHEIDSLR